MIDHRNSTDVGATNTPVMASGPDIWEVDTQLANWNPDRESWIHTTQGSLPRCTLLALWTTATTVTITLQLCSHWPCTFLRSPYVQAMNPWGTYKEHPSHHLYLQAAMVFSRWPAYLLSEKQNQFTWISDELACMCIWVLHYDDPWSPAWSATNWPHQPTISPIVLHLVVSKGHLH